MAMKVACEICGGEIIKDGGVFSCIACGCKYSLNEVKAMVGSLNSNEPASVKSPNDSSDYGKTQAYIDYLQAGIAIQRELRMAEEEIRHALAERDAYYAFISNLEHNIDAALKCGQDYPLSELTTRFGGKYLDGTPKPTHQNIFAIFPLAESEAQEYDRICNADYSYVPGSRKELWQRVAAVKNVIQKEKARQEQLASAKTTAGFLKSGVLQGEIERIDREVIPPLEKELKTATFHAERAEKRISREGPEYDARYNAEKEYAKTLYSNRLPLAETRKKIYEAAKGEYGLLVDNQVHELETVKNGIVERLGAFYGQGPVYEKYCYLEAFSTMLDYFRSGRCSELTGPDGAYNLFEAELRADIIVANIREVNERLSVIEKNQKSLFEEVLKINQTLVDIDERLTGIGNDILSSASTVQRSLQEIKQLSAVTAYSTSRTAYWSEVNARIAASPTVSFGMLL